jgi:hypothetical protein
MGNFHRDIRVEQVIICADDNTELMLRVDYHDALKVNMLSPLLQRVALAAVLNAWTQSPRQVAI